MIAARDRRAVVIGLAAIAGVWVALRGAPRARAWLLALHDRSAAATLALARARETLAIEPLSRESLSVRAARLVAHAPQLFAGASANEAAAELSSFVGGAAAIHRVRIARQDARPDSAVSVFTRLTLRLEAECDAEGLAGWIAALEEDPHLIEVQALTVSAPEPAAPVAQPERLRADLVIVALGSIRNRRS